MAKKQNKKKARVIKKKKVTFPKKFPFWARLKIEKNRTTLVIDEAPVENRRTKKIEDGYVHREATSKFKKGREEINPNPDKDNAGPMYLKRATKTPKQYFKVHNKNLDMPKHLRDRYEKNNKK